MRLCGLCGGPFHEGRCTYGSKNLATEAHVTGEGDASVAGQLSLDLSPLVQPDTEPEASLEDKFNAFHASNPHVLVALETLARQYLAAGRKRIGIGMLYEVLRFTAGLRTTGDEYALDNNHRAFYARLMVARHPEWRDAFRMRTSQADAA